MYQVEQKPSNFRRFSVRLAIPTSKNSLVRSGERSGAEVLWSPNELYDTIGHETNGCVAYRRPNESPNPNIEEVPCACIGSRAPSGERVSAKKAERTLSAGRGQMVQ
jgi:hypothetical protein